MRSASDIHRRRGRAPSRMDGETKTSLLRNGVHSLRSDLPGAPDRYGSRRRRAPGKASIRRRKLDVSFLQGMDVHMAGARMVVFAHFGGGASASHSTRALPQPEHFAAVARQGLAFGEGVSGFDPPHAAEIGRAHV